MIGYVTIGTNDLERALPFYDAVMEPLGGRRTITTERMQFYGGDASPGMFAVSKPYDEKPATAGNGSMFGLPAQSTEQVDAAHATALKSGGTCDGPPGLRLPTFYAAYFRDLDGNKVCIFYMGK
jgi:catechol 2,3-dioxygenase-like lactoylglutathione lyase family enzyme